MASAEAKASQLLAELIRIPSVNPMGRDLTGAIYGEERLSDFLMELFQSWGVPAVRWPVHPRRDNVVALFEPPTATGSVLLDAHQDTVPIDGMSIAPFEPRVEQRRIYGRGACDVKGGMAAMLAAFLRLVQERPRQCARVFLSATCDEEATASGIQTLVQNWPAISQQLCGQAIAPDAAVVAEPTALNIVVAHLGVVRWRAVTVGRACHSSTPDLGVNAIYSMAHLVDALSDYDARLKSQGPLDPLCGRASLSVGRIEGGTSVNVVPDQCRIEIDRRLVPGEQPAEVVQQVEQFVREHLDDINPNHQLNWYFEAPFLTSPPLAYDLNRKLGERLARCVDAAIGGTACIGVRFGTHASRVAAAGIPAVVFGPGSIEQAHTKDEWIDLDQVEKAAEIYYRFCCQAVWG